MTREEIIEALSKLGDNGHNGIDFDEWQAINAAIECLRTDGLWHPASELPPVDENGNSPELIAITSDGMLMRVYFHQESKEYSFWVEGDDWNKQVRYGVNVKWWCYPPKED